MKGLLGIGIAVAAGLLLARIAISDDAIPMTFTTDGAFLYLAGEIDSDTLDDFETVIKDNPQVTTLVACNIPGSLDHNTMIDLAYTVREMGLQTYLTATSMVASGGTDLFLAGVERTMEAGARIGVHSWSDGENDAADFPRESSEHDMNADYIADMLGADDFYWFTIYAAPAADMHWMTQAEVADYGLLTQPLIAPGQSDITCP